MVFLYNYSFLFESILFIILLFLLFQCTYLSICNFNNKSIINFLIKTIIIFVEVSFMICFLLNLPWEYLWLTTSLITSYFWSFLNLKMFVLYYILIFKYLNLTFTLWSYNYYSFLVTFFYICAVAVYSVFCSLLFVCNLGVLYYLHIGSWIRCISSDLDYLIYLLKFILNLYYFQLHSWCEFISTLYYIQFNYYQLIPNNDLLILLGIKIYKIYTVIFNLYFLKILCNYLILYIIYTQAVLNYCLYVYTKCLIIYVMYTLIVFDYCLYIYTKYLIMYVMYTLLVLNYWLYLYTIWNIIIMKCIYFTIIYSSKGMYVYIYLVLGYIKSLCIKQFLIFGYLAKQAVIGFIFTWNNFYNFPIWNLDDLFISHYYTPNFYNYTLFDTTNFIFLTKNIILIFIIIYWLLIYYYNLLRLKTHKTFKSTTTLFSYEYPVLIGFLWLSYVFVVSTNNLFIVYLGFEMQTFIILILAGQLRNYWFIVTTNLKYFFLSFLSSLLFLLSCLYFLLSLGTINYYEIYYWLLYNFTVDLHGFFLVLSIVFLLLSFLFKLGAFPFYIWILDIFQGFPTMLTLLLLTLHKFNLYIFLIKLLTILTTINGFYLILIINILTYSGLISLILGCLLAISQTNIQRFFGATSLSHIGLLLLLLKYYLLNNNIVSLQIIYSYFYLYMIFTFFFLSIIILWDNLLLIDKKIIELKDLIYCSSTKIRLILILILISLSGFPPFSFFYIKINVLLISLQNLDYLSSAILLYTSILLGIGYFRLVIILIKDSDYIHTYNYFINHYYFQTKQYYMWYYETIAIFLVSSFSLYNYFI